MISDSDPLSLQDTKEPVSKGDDSGQTASQIIQAVGEDGDLDTEDMVRMKNADEQNVENLEANELFADVTTVDETAMTSHCNKEDVEVDLSLMEQADNRQQTGTADTSEEHVENLDSVTADLNTDGAQKETKVCEEMGNEDRLKDIASKETQDQASDASSVVSQKSNQTDKRVTFSSKDVDVSEEVSEVTPLSEGALRLKLELEQMNIEDDKQRKLEKERKRAEVAKLKASLIKEHAKRNISLDMNSDLYRKFISDELTKEEIIALKTEQDKLDDETRQMAREIDKKHGISQRKKAGSVDRILRRLEKEAKQQAKQDEITRELTREEIQDLHVAFDMFDTKRRGLITVSDLKRLLKMLKFTTGRGILKDMITKLDKAKRGIVDFNDFLQLVVTGQGDGPDPFEEIIQGFELIDTEGKGYITFEDLRTAADGISTVFSNTMLREMMTEADCTGDGRISQKEFVKIMLDTNRYRAIKRAMLG